VAAASDLKFALEAVAQTYADAGGQAPRLVFGSSGQLFAQILQGAPFQMFMSADEDYVFRLAEAGLARDRGLRYATGRIGLLVPQGSPLKPDGELRDLAAALRDGRLRRLAIANPQHAPYGRRAQEALQQAGLWEAVQPHLVIGENVAQAAQFAVSGSTQGGIVAHSLALAPALARQSAWGLIPETWHRPLAQRMVLLQGAGQGLQRFHDYLLTSGAQAVMARFGFQRPT
jgi:molybdate transport system substrate-binding protein